jgi:hypothetical protein
MPPTFVQAYCVGDVETHGRYFKHNRNDVILLGLSCYDLIDDHLAMVDKTIIKTLRPFLKALI